MQSPKSIKHKTIISKAAPQAVKSILVCNANRVKPKTKTTVMPTAIKTSSALKAVTAHPSMTPSTKKRPTFWINSSQQFKNLRILTQSENAQPNQISRSFSANAFKTRQRNNTDHTGNKSHPKHPLSISSWVNFDWFDKKYPHDRHCHQKLKGQNWVDFSHESTSDISLIEGWWS